MDEDRTALDDAGYSNEQAIAGNLESYLRSVVEGLAPTPSISCRVYPVTDGSGYEIRCDIQQVQDRLAETLDVLRQELSVINSRGDGVGGYALDAVIPQIWSEAANSSRRLFTVKVRGLQMTPQVSPGTHGADEAVAAAGNFGRSREDYDHVIVLVHGIRDIGAWQSKVSRGLDHPGTTTKQVRFGLYPAVRFLLPINLSGGPVRKVTNALNDLKYEYPKARISIIAHSFGTYVVLKMLERDPNIQLWKLVFCGSVANDQFRWSELKRRIGDGKRPTCDFIVNDCGTGDVWPVLGSAFGWFYGMAGATGFSEGFVTNRFHRAKGGTSGGHGLYFDPDFVEAKWKPFLIDDAEPAPGDGDQGEHLAWCVRLLYHGWARWVCRCVMLVFWLSVVALAALGIWWVAASVVARATE